MFSVKSADDAIIKESHELITDARREAIKMPNRPGKIVGRNSLAIIPNTRSGWISLPAKYAIAANPVRVQALVQILLI
jgi:hypothetical protein